MATELSIIVPILNEEEQLPCLLTDLIRQQQVDFELLVCDAGSRDESLSRLYSMRDHLPYPVRVVECKKGRGQQLNSGADAASSDWLLFLHVDSRFDDPLALRKGLDTLQAQKHSLIAGHFALRFRRSAPEPSSSYYYYEWKARLDRPECLHGDQGMLLTRLTFRTVGLFRKDLPVMEDTDFAERLRLQGRWILLPAEISTSARRFEQEGLEQRQLINAIIMNFRSIGWSGFFSSGKNIYQHQQQTGRLLVLPFLRQVKQLLAQKSPRERRSLWFRSGCYVRRHAWQLAFVRDSRRAFRAGKPPGKGKLFYVSLFELPYNLLTDNPLGRLAATLLLRIWFQWTYYRAWRIEKDFPELKKQKISTASARDETTAEKTD